MKFNQYVTEVLKTESNDFIKIAERVSLQRNIRLLHASLGIMTEISELFEMLDKPKLDLTNLREECSDAMWYIGVAVDELKINPDEFIKKTLSKKRKINFLNKFLVSKKVNIIRVLSKSTVASSNLLDLMKKSLFYGREIDLLKFESLMIEIMAEMVFLLEIGNFDYEEAMDVNINKLQKKRFKSGKFTQEEAVIRNLVEERKALEQKD